MEGMVRTLLSQPDPPAVVLLNHFSYRDWNCKSECRFVESCDAGLGEIARSYHVGTISVRDALYHDASPFDAQNTAQDTKYMWDSWTQDTGKHFTLERGARIAAELLHSCFLRSVTTSRPFAHPALRRTRSLYGNAPSAGTCFSFDDTFGGSISEPKVVSMIGWQKKLHEISQQGEKKVKPGLVATERGAKLVLDTAVGGSAVQVGYLLTAKSHAIATLSCLHPCKCGNLTISSHTQASTSTTVFTQPHALQLPASSGQATCLLSLIMNTDGERFKLVGLQVVNS